MSIIDSILGGNNSDSSQASSDMNDQSTVIGSSPALGLSLDDVLHSSSNQTDGSGGDSDMSDFTGIGGLDLGLQAPTFIGTSSSSESQSASETDGGSGGGLLSGLF